MPILLGLIGNTTAPFHDDNNLVDEDHVCDTCGITPYVEIKVFLWNRFFKNHFQNNDFTSFFQLILVIMKEFLQIKLMKFTKMKHNLLTHF